MNDEKILISIEEVINRYDFNEDRHRSLLIPSRFFGPGHTTGHV